MNQNHQSERGQVIVLLVLALVVLLGFTALAVDGGMLYSDRRHAQNAADASSLAGGGAAALSLENNHVTYQEWNCSDGRVIAAEQQARDAAINRAASNDYVIDEDISDNHGVTTRCGRVNNVGWVDKFIDVRTIITTDTRPSLAHILYKGPLRNTVEAITRVRPHSPLAYGNAIMALRKDCPNSDTGGVRFDGTSDIVVTGGGIFSNACMTATGNVDVHVNDGGIACVGSGCYTSSGHPELHPAPQEASIPLPDFSITIPAPDCSSLPNRGSHSGSGSIQPGRYTRIRLNSDHDVLEMNPGLYCISEDFVANGGTITGNGVTIYIISGDFDVAGGVHVVLTAPPAVNCAYCPPAIPGVLIYLAEGNTGEAALLGTSDSEYLGTVYVPSGTIEAGGTGSELSEIHAQLIGDTVKLHGTTSVVINFEGSDNYQKPAMMELFK